MRNGPILFVGALVIGAAALAAGSVARANDHAAAACDYPILSLADATHQAQTAVIADVIRERPAPANGYDSTLRVAGVIKGRSTGPVVTINGLGHLEDDCTGGPRLTRGNRYVLFLAWDEGAPAATWGLTDGEGGVYRLANDGVRFPPDHALGQPQQVAIASADFVRNVGILAGADQSRIEALISQLGLSETFERSAATASSDQQSLIDRLPKRETLLAVAAAAVLFASLVFLLWHPSEPRLPRRR